MTGRRVPVLVAFAGLPGVGKTTIAKGLALASGATYLRVDTIEQALREGGAGEVGPQGYGVMTALACENLTLGRDVIADSVNPLPVTREALAAAARSAGARLIDVEVVCSDIAAHRRRVEGRRGDIAGLAPPDWAAVVDRTYLPWTEPRIVIDTARLGVAQAVAALLAQMDG